MKKYFLITLLFPALFTFTSCEDPIDVAVPQGETMLVIDAFVTDQQQPQKIKLTTTAPYFSNTNAPIVNGAVVTILDITNGKSFSFTDAGSGNYIFTPQPADSFAIVNHEYKLNVSWNNYDYYSLCKLNRTTPVDTIIFIDGTGQPGFGEGYFPYIYAFDQPNAKDYYWIKTYKNGKYISNPININVVEDAGGDGTDGIAFIPPNAFYNVTPADDPFKTSASGHAADECTVEIVSINRDCYEFFLQAQKQMTNSSAGLFATTPENVRTNINAIDSAPKAIGWFNIGALSSKTLTVQ
jgi:hypothetical protein